MKHLILLLLSFNVYADEVKTFSWTVPTEYTNALPLPDNEISSYMIICDDGGGMAFLASVANTGATNTYQQVLATGSYTCFVRTIATNGLESAPSNTVNFTVGVSTPNAPTLFQVN